MTSLDIGLAFDLKPTRTPLPGAPIDADEEFDGEDTIDALIEALAALGHRPRRLGGGRRFLEAMLERPPQLVFNLAEGCGSRSREAQVPAVCEMLGVACTGSDPLVMALTLDKPLAKRVVQSAGIRTADFRVVESGDAIDTIDMPYPLFVKPAAEGSSMGVRATSLVRSAEELHREVRRCLEQYRQPVIVETFLAGAEATVAVQGTGANAQVLGAMGIMPAAGPIENFVYGLESKRNYKVLVRYQVPPCLPPDLLEDAETVALNAYRVLGCRDLARVDVRFDARGRAHFIEINPLPGLNPVTGDICLIAKGIGMPYITLVGRVIEETVRRNPQLR